MLLESRTGGIPGRERITCVMASFVRKDTSKRTCKTIIEIAGRRMGPIIAGLINLGRISGRRRNSKNSKPQAFFLRPEILPGTPGRRQRFERFGAPELMTI